MKLSYLIQRIEFKLGQYVFTEMFGQDDIIDEINNAVVDVMSYPVVRDFAVGNYNNINSAVATAATYTMDTYVRDIVEMNAIINGAKVEMYPMKFGQFSNWNNQTETVYEYTRGAKTVTLSEAQDVEIIYMKSPKVYTNADLDLEMDLPNDFIGILKDIVLANMLPIYYSDGLAIADRYFQKSELRLQRLGSKYGRKYANKGFAVATPGKGQTQSVRQNATAGQMF